MLLPARCSFASTCKQMLRVKTQGSFEINSNNIIMKVKKLDDKDESRIVFIAETEEEMRILGSLRNHFFFGLPEKGTYPQYDGVDIENNFVTVIRLMYKTFQ